MQIEVGPAAVFQQKAIPTGSRLAGWSALARTFRLAVPVRQPSSISEQRLLAGRAFSGEWQVFDSRYWPGDSFADHLEFAFRHEQLELPVFKRLCEAAPASEFAEMVRSAPAGSVSRRVWFLYESLTGRTLDVEDAGKVTAVDVLPADEYFTGEPRLSRRHRVRDNLLGTAQFCPIVRRTKALAECMELDLAAKARATVGRTGPHLVSRAASFLLLADSRASFEIEGERPPRNRLERWGRAVVQAGRNPLTLAEVLRLQNVLIEDRRFVQPGLRTDGVFLGERDHFGEPLPEFIGARPGDLPALMDGLLAANDRMREDGVDAVIKAAATAFGFVYVHPFQDGNGRMHRCLIHHVLAERGFTPPGMVFPVSAVMLDRIDDYRRTLQAHSAPLMPFIEWRPTVAHNVEVVNDTADLYRYFDATGAAEFLYSCVRRTVEEDLPREIEYLRLHDEAMRRVMSLVEMPDRTAETLIRSIRQNEGRLSKRRREGEFQALRDDEVAAVEEIVNDVFGDDQRL